MNPVQSVVSNLIAYLKSEVPDLASVQAEFPTANIALQYPALTIFSGQPKFTNAQPYEVSRTDPNGSNQVVSVMAIGEYDLNLQLDLWCRTKIERETVFGLLFSAINKQVIPMGLSLQLHDYFDEWARYDVDGYQFVDDEAGAQRQEWRVKLDLMVNVRALTSMTNYGMITFDKDITTPNTI